MRLKAGLGTRGLIKTAGHDMQKELITSYVYPAVSVGGHKGSEGRHSYHHH